jgi:hypothetical protein
LHAIYILIMSDSDVVVDQEGTVLKHMKWDFEVFRFFNRISTITLRKKTIRSTNFFVSRKTLHVHFDKDSDPFMIDVNLYFMNCGI